MDEDGFDFMKISFLRDIKAQNRSLRFVSSLVCTTVFLEITNLLVLLSLLAETIRRLMLVRSTMMSLSLGMKRAMLHFLVLPKMRLTSPMLSTWSIQDAAYL